MASGAAANRMTNKAMDGATDGIRFGRACEWPHLGWTDRSSCGDGGKCEAGRGSVRSVNKRRFNVTRWSGQRGLAIGAFAGGFDSYER